MAQVHVSSVLSSRDRSMAVRSPVTFTVDLRLTAIVPVIVKRDPRILSHTSSVVPSSLVRTTADAGCDDVSFAVRKPVPEGRVSVCL